MFKVIAAAALLCLGALGAQAQEWRKLLTPQELHALLQETDARVIDLRVAEGADSYALGHIPGSVNAPYATWRGPKENPGAVLSDAVLTERLQSAGVEADAPVVLVYWGADQSDFGAAARVYWTLKSSGISQIAILNGGFKAWREAGLPVDAAPTVPARSAITAKLSPQWLATREQVQAIVEGRSEAVLVDARPDAFFRAEKKHDAAKAAGTLSGAVSLVFDRWFTPESPLMSAPAPALERARALAAEANGKPIVSFCNTGHWAAINWFALSELAGVPDVKLYPESMVGWTSADLPVKPGA
ncbi:MAG: sulfurtransferase [Alphaproteobacteria bacterium HGW-Alphaproteobacteria-8]|nr:MAG: sulfurtransferase [Alphaproteobacteria bacterium HGW-Alphaproteobacteria-8]